MNNDVRRELYKELSKYVQFTGTAILGFFGYLIKLRFENDVKDVEPLMIIVGIGVVGLFVLGSIFLVLGAKKSTNAND